MWVEARPRDTEACRSKRGRRGWGCGQCLTAPPILRTTSFKFSRRMSLVARQSIIRLPVQETLALSLDRERSPLASRQLSHNRWAYALEPGTFHYGSPCTLESVLRKREVTARRRPSIVAKSAAPPSSTPQSLPQQWRPSTVKTESI